MRKPTLLQTIINRLVIVPQGNPRFWAKESKLAKELIAKYGDAFMLWVPAREGYRVPSLAFFKTPAGQSYLSDQLFEYTKATTNLSQETKVVAMSETKIGEDVVVTRKPKSLKDFLK
jgi:hypothetical protein